MKLVISDANDGEGRHRRRVAGTAWQRCGVHLMRNLLATVPKGQAEMVAALVRTLFARPTPKHPAASPSGRRLARAQLPKAAPILAEAEHEVTADATFPR